MFHHQVTQEGVISFLIFQEWREHMRNERKNNEYFSLQKKKIAKSGTRKICEKLKNNETQNTKYFNKFFYSCI